MSSLLLRPLGDFSELNEKILCTKVLHAIFVITCDLRAYMQATSVSVRMTSSLLYLAAYEHYLAENYSMAAEHYLAECYSVADEQRI